MATRLRLGRIDYINADPFFCEHAPPPDVEPWAAKPTALNRAILAGELPLSWISSVELLRNPDQLLLCPPSCIAAPGPVRSVVLVTPRPFEELDGATVWLSSHSATSVALLKTLLAEAGLRCRYETFHHAGPTPARDELPPGPLLLIGDEALRLSPPPGHEVIDLGERWRQLTGLPMVFAVLALRREVLRDDAALERVDHALAWMDANKQSFRADPTGSQAYRERTASLDAGHYRRYFEGFCFDWNEQTEAGYATFGERTRRIGLTPSGTCPEVYEPSRRATRPLEPARSHG